MGIDITIFVSDLSKMDYALKKVKEIKETYRNTNIKVYITVGKH